jgi:hypothetical protein
MSGWQPQEYDPRRQGPAMPPQWGQQPDPWGASTGYGPQGQQQLPAQYRDPRPPQQPYQAPQQPYQALPQQFQAPQQFTQPRHAARASGLTAAGSFWYVLQCIAFGAGYFAKVPAKKALQDAGLARMTAAEQFWYVLMCIGFGAGYFAKLPVAKALSEMQRR